MKMPSVAQKLSVGPEVKVSMKLQRRDYVVYDVCGSPLGSDSAGK